MAEKKTKKTQQFIKASLKWHIPDNIITRFANHMIIQRVDNEFKISFFETQIPIRLAASDPAPKEVLAECVASIIVTRDKLPTFIEALKKQLDIYDSTEKQSN